MILSSVPKNERVVNGIYLNVNGRRVRWNGKRGIVLCERELCSSSRPAFNIPGSRTGILCAEHKKAGMINVKSKRCEKCSSTPNFNIPGTRGGRFCATHKEEFMIDVTHKKCEKCSLIPAFNFPENLVARFCFEHRENGMINVLTKKCEKCFLIPIFNYPGNKTARFCASHKLQNMINVINKRCKLCSTIPLYNFPGNSAGIFCNKHKEETMIDVKSKRCEKCSSRPNFNFPGFRTRRFCSIHKENFMIDVGSKRCERCSLGPAFNFPDNLIARYCFKHRENGMINVKTKRCEHCNTCASYGKPGNSATLCAKHRIPGTIVRPKSKCQICKKNPAIWGSPETWIPLRCDTHHYENDINYVEEQCQSCALTFLLDKNGLCEFCNPVTFQSTRLAKQNALMSFLDTHELVGTTTDTTIEKGECGLERPDRVYDFGDKIVILECDEHQHRERNCLCEQTRMINIGQSFGGVPVYFIRWNPDNYIPGIPDEENEENQKTKNQKTKNQKTKKSKKSKKNQEILPELLKKRHEDVKNVLKDIRDGRFPLPENAFVSAYYMFYDEWIDIHTETWKTLSCV